VLDAYRHRLPSFNDDIQGTSAVACAAVLAGLRGLGKRLVDQSIVIFGAGTAGCGIAERLVRLMVNEGLEPGEASGRLWLLNRRGLVHDGMEELSAMVRPYARSAEELAELRRRDLLPPAESGETIGLQAVIDAVKPAVLIGTSTSAGAFDQPVVESLCRGVERPIVLPLSNPTQLAEVTPADLMRWSGGRALVATGSPFDPVMVNGRERVIGQCNNCFVFPGLGFAAMAVGAREVSEAMIDASIFALVDCIPASEDADAPLMPSLRDVRPVSAAVAEAVAAAAVREGIAARASSTTEASERLESGRWWPCYRPVRAI
jgi:malate dehydrogenase (oxaloacetate-decarboxylating)